MPSECSNKKLLIVNSFFLYLLFIYTKASTVSIPGNGIAYTTTSK